MLKRNRSAKSLALMLIMSIAVAVLMVGCSSTPDLSNGPAKNKDGDIMFLMSGDYFRDQETGVKMDFEGLYATTDIKTATWNDADNTVTITISEADYQKLMDELRTQVNTTYEAMVEDTEFAAYVSKIEANDDYSVVTAYVNDMETYTEDDAFYNVAPEIDIYASMYQDYMGMNEKGTQKVRFVNEETNEVLLTLTFPDAWSHIMN